MRAHARDPKRAIFVIFALADLALAVFLTDTVGFAMDPLFRSVALSSRRLSSLAELGAEAAAALKGSKQNVTIFESTTAGLIQAALQSVPGASSYTTCGAVTYGKDKAQAVLGAVDLGVPRPTDGASYKDSKRQWTQRLARYKRQEVGATWCICESGACGPTFTFPDVTQGFTAIFVSGPVEKGLFVESETNEREDNMWGFTKLALDLLAECIEESRGVATVASKQVLVAKEDRYGGVEAEVSGSNSDCSNFAVELRQYLQAWTAAGKKGIWLKVPLAAAACVGPAVAQGFEFHHAKAEYLLLTRWLSEEPNTLPKYSFTQVGVGGVVLNSKGEVLMVQERISPLPQFQGSWKLPGGLADPGEDFAETAAREVQEETGVTGSLLGLVSLRHSHGYRFGQDDIYVVVKLQALEETIRIDPHELSDAQWMSMDRIQSLVAEPGQSWDGKVSENTWQVISNALSGAAIEGSALPNSRGGKMSMLYTAPKPG